MVDLANMSDEQLLQLRGQAQQPSISNVSDDELLEMRQNAIGQQEASILQLVGQLGGQLPTQGPLPPAMRFLSSSPGAITGTTSPNPAFQSETQRRRAFSSLTKMGFGPDQVQTVLDIQKRVNPGLIGQIKQNIGEEAGGIAGGVAGAKLGALVGQIPPFTALPEEAVTIPLFAAAGAFIGGGGGRATQQAIDPLESPSARDFIKSGTTQALFEGAGRLVRPVAKGFGLGQKPIEAVEEAKRRFKLEDGFFTPAQRDSRLTVKAAEQLSRGSFGGGPIFSAYNLSQQGQAIEIMDDIIRRVAGGAAEDPKVLGQELAGIFTRLGEKGQQVKGVRQTLLDSFFDDLYKQVDELSPGAQFPTAPIKAFAKKKLKEDTAQGGALLTAEGRGRLQNIIKSLADNRSADEMRQLRSLYTKDARRFQLGGDQSTTVFSELAEVADDILFDPGAEAGLTEPARKMLRNINAVYGPSKQLYDETIVKDIVRKLNAKPTLVNTLIGEKPDPKELKTLREILISPVRKVSGSGQSAKTIAKELRAAKGALKNPRAIELLSKNTAEGKVLWNQVKAGWLRNQLESAIDRTTGVFNVKKFDKAIKGMDPESFRILFPGDVGRDIKAASGLLDVITPEKAGLSTLFGKGIEFSGAGAVGSGLSAGSGIRIIKGGILSLGPATYAKIATNPRANKILTLGIKQQSKGKAVNIPALAARLINEINRSDAEDQAAIKRQRKASEAISKELRRRRQQPAQVERFRGAF